MILLTRSGSMWRDGPRARKPCATTARPETGFRFCPASPATRLTVPLTGSGLPISNIPARNSTNAEWTDPAICCLPAACSPCNPRWSPDGKRIAFAGQVSGKNKNLGLWLVSSDGGDAAPYRSEIDFGYDAIWSKDGKRILFAQGGITPDALPPGESRIRILDLETGKIQVIPKGDNLFSPRWSPDEKQLLALDIHNLHLHVFDAVKSEWRELTKVVSGYPTWSTDGKWIYAFDQPGNVVFRVEVATGRREEIVRPDFPIASNWGAWVGWTDDWDPIMLRDLGSNQIYRIDLDR